jgi:hypothetical protein
MVAMAAWFAEGWEREQKRREIAELEELARILLVIYATGSVTAPVGIRER